MAIALFTHGFTVNHHFALRLTSQHRSCLNNTLFDNLMTFASGAGAKVVFGLNLAKRTHDNK